MVQNLLAKCYTIQYCSILQFTHFYTIQGHLLFEIYIDLKSGNNNIIVLFPYIKQRIFKIRLFCLCIVIDL